MNFLYKILLTINSTSWMIIIYAIKERWTIRGVPICLFGILLLFVPVVLSFISVCLSKKFGNESLARCKEISLADGEFLPVYLGYFFVSVGVTDDWTMFIVFIIVFIFTFVSQTQYYNPLLLLFGYHYYHVLTSNGTRIFIIKKGKIIRNMDDVSLSGLRRINDTTYIERE